MKSAVHKAAECGRVALDAEPDEIDRQLRENVDLKQQQRSRGKAAMPVSYAEAQTRLEILKADEKELKLNILRGTLVDREDVNRAFYEMGVALRQPWESWPARVATVFAGEINSDNPHLVETVLTRLVKDQLREIGVAAGLKLRGDVAV